MIPLYPYSGFNFWTKQVSELLFLDTARSALYLIAKHYSDYIFLMPAYTCPTVWSALNQANVEYDFVDIADDLDFLESDLENMLKKYKNGNIALIATSLFGAKIKDYKEKFPDLLIVEDRAQGLFCENSNADFQVLSFGKGKMVSGFGGGAILDKNGILKDEIAQLKTNNDFLQSYILSIAQKAISRVWFLLEGTKIDPEMNEKLTVEKIFPAQISPIKQRWISNTIKNIDFTKRVAIANFYAKNIKKEYQFSIDKDMVYLRFPIKKDIKFSGISKMRDYHETYYLACEKRGREMDGAKKLVEVCFLPTHDLVDLEYAKKVAELVNV